MLYARRDTAQAQMRSLGHFFKAGTTLEEKMGLAGGSYELLQAVPAVLDYLGDHSSPRWAAVEAQEQALQVSILESLFPDLVSVLDNPVRFLKRFPSIHIGMKPYFPVTNH
jgi:hypothetical protein